MVSCPENSECFLRDFLCMITSRFDSRRTLRRLGQRRQRILLLSKHNNRTLIRHNTSSVRTPVRMCSCESVYIFDCCQNKALLDKIEWEEKRKEISFSGRMITVRCKAQMIVTPNEEHHINTYPHTRITLFMNFPRECNSDEWSGVCRGSSVLIFTWIFLFARIEIESGVCVWFSFILHTNPFRRFLRYSSTFQWGTAASWG